MKAQTDNVSILLHRLEDIRDTWKIELIEDRGSISRFRVVLLSDGGKEIEGDKYFTDTEFLRLFAGPMGVELPETEKEE